MALSSGVYPSILVHLLRKVCERAWKVVLAGIETKRGEWEKTTDCKSLIDRFWPHGTICLRIVIIPASSFIIVEVEARRFGGYDWD